MGSRRASKERGTSQSDNAALALSGWVGVVLVAIGLTGLYFAPGALFVWMVLIVFGVTAVPMAFRALRRDRAGGRRRHR